MAEPSAFFLPGDSDGAWLATEATAGPWDPRLQHGGPPSALLARAMAAVAGDGMRFARLTFEILGAVPVGPVEVDAQLTRPGKRVQMLEAELVAAGRPAMRARAWQVAPSPSDDVAAADAPAPMPGDETPPPPPWDASGYLRAIEWRFAAGGFDVLGPATVWTRPRIPLVPGEEWDGIGRVLLVADSGNGVSAMEDLREWYFINPELTVHTLRPARGEWVCLDARTAVAAGGAGLARSTLSDLDGPLAFGAQALLVDRR